MASRVRRAFRAPKGYRRSDERIREDVCDRLGQSGDLDPSDVEVSVSNGEVSLRGTVPERFMKWEAEQLADAVAGVVDIHNQIRVRREGEQSQTAQAATTTTTSHARGTHSRGS
jgi:osmotically-inducible protein OsmY